ncbi:premnaspirodiene oxygenase [Phtheirospermum japonicum]|uniref:Premnaspirodiene oxygenase n=1 Tax=Phtheirospermum japonicum TaxID=374723 RepID=A0A830DGJ4_9LAMI|nr:premnaspirodiene oxygenase [Phtheirospermum japonicum]
MPPGPTGLPLVGNLLSLDPELHTYFASLGRTYGPIYTLKLGRKTGIVITSPAIAKQVLRDHDTTFANRDVPVAGKEATYGGFGHSVDPVRARVADAQEDLRARDARRQDVGFGLFAPAAGDPGDG